MTQEQSKIDQKVRPLILDVMHIAAPYEQARAFLFLETVRKENPELDNDAFIEFINKRILNETRPH